MEYKHTPVLLEEILHHLDIQPDDVVVDGTAGGGGHTIPMAKLAKQVIAFDRDPAAIKAAKTNAKRHNLSNIVFVNDSYININHNASLQRHLPVNAILCDLGVSSAQLQDTARGFSFQHPQLLDMRFDPDGQKLTAQEIVNTWAEQDIIDLLKVGDEPLAKPIARRIVALRQDYDSIPADVLVNEIEDIYRKKFKKKSRMHPATRTWQALRIAVNQELKTIAEALPEFLKALAPGGKMAIISFHSGEDRIVKQFFKKAANPCDCPPEIPKCNCGQNPSLRIITKKVVKATDEEIKNNPRSRSALLRVVEKI